MKNGPNEEILAVPSEKKTQLLEELANLNKQTSRTEDEIYNLTQIIAEDPTSPEAQLAGESKRINEGAINNQRSHRLTLAHKLGITYDEAVAVPFLPDVFGSK